MGLLSLRFWVYTLGHWELTTWLLSWNPLSSSYQRWEANTGFHFITWVAGTYSHFLVFIIFIYWLCQVSVAAHGIFSCGIQTLGCGMWDLVPWPGIEPRLPALGVQSLSHWTATKVPNFKFQTNRKGVSESEVAQSCPALLDPMDCSLPGSSVHGIFQARVLQWGAIAFS